MFKLIYYYLGSVLFCSVAGNNVYLNDAVHGSSRNTNGNARSAQNIGGNSENIYGESRSEIIKTSTHNDDIDQHEYEYVDNPG